MHAEFYFSLYCLKSSQLGSVSQKLGWCWLSHILHRQSSTRRGLFCCRNATARQPCWVWCRMWAVIPNPRLWCGCLCCGLLTLHGCVQHLTSGRNSLVLSAIRGVSSVFWAKDEDQQRCKAYRNGILLRFGYSFLFAIATLKLTLTSSDKPTNSSSTWAITFTASLFHWEIKILLLPKNQRIKEIFMTALRHLNSRSNLSWGMYLTHLSIYPIWGINRFASRSHQWSHHAKSPYS